MNLPDPIPASPPPLTLWRRLPTTIALAGLIIVIGLYLAMWTIALTQGNVADASNYFAAPPQFRGNHGPWRHDRVLRTLSEYASLLMILAVLPLASAGCFLERTRRTGIVAALSLAMMVIDCAHFPLFD